MERLKIDEIKEKGITLVALVITIVILIILAVVTINVAFGDNGLIKQAEKASAYQANADASDSKLLNDATSYIDGIIGGSGDSMLENKETKANIPILTSGMIPIKWNGFTEITTTEDDEEWYSYERQSSGTENGGTSRWANAKNSDGSYFVWIPRYAYKITYYTDSSKTTVSAEKTIYANIDIVFLEGTSNNYVDKNGVEGVAQTIPSGVGENYTNSQKNGDRYTVHPAFTNGYNTGYVNGEWDKDMSGFWIAKYEMSMETDGLHTETNSSTVGNVLTNERIKAVSKPGVSSWRYCQIGNFYTNGLNYEPNSNSHAIKNSEWGAVVYLTYSEYGRNGTKITINNSSSYITGNAGDTVNSSSTAEVNNEYNTEKGVLASTTGNIYGVYDISGGATEYTMSYITSGYSSLTKNGSSFTAADSNEGNTSFRAKSTKYSTAYPQGESTTTEVGIETGYDYWNSIYGDAITEISINENNPDTVEYKTIYDVVISVDRIESYRSSREPFFNRGGDCHSSYRAGAFQTGDAGGGSGINYTSRFIIIP